MDFVVTGTKIWYLVGATSSGVTRYEERKEKEKQKRKNFVFKCIYNYNNSAIASVGRRPVVGDMKGKEREN